MFSPKSYKGGQAMQYKRYNSYATYFRYTVRIIDG